LISAVSFGLPYTLLNNVSMEYKLPFSSDFRIALAFVFSNIVAFVFCYTSDMGGYTILGGTQRYRALCDIGVAEVTIELADDWTPQQRDEFLIKDNTHYGKWDMDTLANEWDAVELAEWGLHLPEPQEEKQEKESCPTCGKSV